MEYILTRETVETLMDALILRLEDGLFELIGLPDDELADAATHLLEMDAAFKEVRGGHWLTYENLAEIQDLAQAVA